MSIQGGAGERNKRSKPSPEVYPQNNKKPSPLEVATNSYNYNEGLGE